MRVTLTFDNGPTPGVTEDVLAALAEHGVRATFFVVGNDLRDRGVRALAERAAAEGHWLGNHTMTHSVRLGEADGDDVVRFEIEGAQRELDGLAHPDRLFRPFGDGVLSAGLLGAAAVRELERGRYTCVLWNCVPRDWEDPDGWVDRCLDDVASRDWSLVVLHDTATGAMAQLPRFLSRLAAMGVEVTHEFPDECVPIRRGVVRGTIDHLLA